MCSLFLSKKTMSRISLCTNADLTAAPFSYPLSVLPPLFGGSSNIRLETWLDERLERRKASVAQVKIPPE